MRCRGLRRARSRRGSRSQRRLLLALELFQLRGRAGASPRVRPRDGRGPHSTARCCIAGLGSLHHAPVSIAKPPHPQATPGSRAHLAPASCQLVGRAHPSRGRHGGCWSRALKGPCTCPAVQGACREAHDGSQLACTAAAVHAANLKRRRQDASRSRHGSARQHRHPTYKLYHRIPCPSCHVLDRRCAAARPEPRRGRADEPDHGTAKHPQLHNTGGTAASRNDRMECVAWVLFICCAADR